MLMKNKLFKIFIPVVLILLIFAGTAVIRGTSEKQLSQFEFSRWGGDSDLDFVQYSCFVPENSALDLEAIYKFRYDMDKAINEASVENTGSSERLFNDAWCCRTKLKAYSDNGSGDVTVFAVGGDFFSFHPMPLVSGSYLREDDIMDDRIMLDRETAWLLYGGMDLTGLTVNIAGTEFVVAGVVDHEQDKYSKDSYFSGNAVYMSYTALTRLRKNTATDKDKAAVIETPTVYELVCPEPVKGFTYNLLEKSFPEKEAEIIENTGRFGYFKLLRTAFTPGKRAVHDKPIAFPYWENASRLCETSLSRYAIAISVFALALIAVLASLAIEGIKTVIAAFRKKKEEAEAEKENTPEAAAPVDPAPEENSASGAPAAEEETVSEESPTAEKPSAEEEPIPVEPEVEEPVSGEAPAAEEPKAEEEPAPAEPEASEEPGSAGPEPIENSAVDGPAAERKILPLKILQLKEIPLLKNLQSKDIPLLNNLKSKKISIPEKLQLKKNIFRNKQK